MEQENMTRPSNESLGPMLKSWTPGKLLRNTWAGKNLPTWFLILQTLLVFISLFFCLWGARLIYQHLLSPIGLSPGLLWGGLVFVILFALPIVLLNWVGQKLVDLNELAVHENGVRWRQNGVLFDQIDSLSMGTETFNEKYFPTLNKLSKAHWRYGKGVKKAEELERTTTLAFHLKDGSVKQWRKFLQCFGPEVLEEFFAKLGERIEIPTASRES